MTVRLRAIRVIQTSVTWLLTRLLRARCRVTTDLPFTFSAHERYLFVANHQSRLDPFAVFTALSYSQMRAVAPTRFMTAGAIYYSFLYPLLVLCGCYPTRKKGAQSYDAVARSVYYLNHGQNVFMFPEGRRTLRTDSQPRGGVKRIFDQAPPEITVIMIHIEWGVRHRQLHVSFSKTTVIESADALMQQIYHL